MDEQLHIQTEEIQKDGSDTFHLHRYEPTPYPVLEELFRQLPFHSNDVIVDYGCGLGRLNFYTEYRFHCKSIGIEYSRAYYERAMENRDSYIGNSENITFLCTLAEEYVVRADENFFYFFNPFSPSIFRRVVNRIIDSWYRIPRKIFLILYYPEDDFLFYLTQHTDFTCENEFSAMPNSTDRRERFSIWTLSPFED